MRVALTSWRGPEGYRDALYATFPVLERCKNRGRTLTPIPILLSGGNLLVKIQDRVNDKANQMNAEDLVEGQG